MFGLRGFWYGVERLKVLKGFSGERDEGTIGPFQLCALLSKGDVDELSLTTLLLTCPMNNFVLY